MWRDAGLQMSQAANHPAILMFKYSNQVITTAINYAAPVSVISRVSKSGGCLCVGFLEWDYSNKQGHFQQVYHFSGRNWVH